MKEAVIVSVVRTPVGKAPKGMFRTTQPEHLSVRAIRAALDRAPGLDPAQIDDVIMGCAFPEAEQGLNCARNYALLAGVPDTVPGVTLTRFCASGLQSIAYAAQAIMSGQAEVLLAGGIESMSRVPGGGNKQISSWEMQKVNPGVYAGMGITAENVAERFNVTREEQDIFAAESQRRALAAIENGTFRDEIVPVEITHKFPGPDGTVVEKTVKDPDAVGTTIRNVVRKSGTKAKQAAVAVSGSAVITKVISMPASLSDREMQTQIQLEADQYIPYPLEEVNLDFSVIGPSEKNPEMVDVLLAASRSENVDARVAALSAAGLTPAVVDVEAYAMENACTLISGSWPLGGADQTVVVADVGAMNTTIHVLHNHRIVYTREQNFGGRHLTEEIQRRYGLSYEEAGMSKRKGGLPDNFIPDVLDPFKEAMSQQVNRGLQFFYSATAFRSVDHIVLAGGCAAITGVDELVEERLGIPTSIANPFANMALAARVNAQNLSNDAPAMMIAVGLALRSFD